MFWGLSVAAASLIGCAHAEVWNCRNDVEVQCADGACAAETEEGNFTPMSLAFNSSGSFSLCAYTGCWAGEGTVVATAPFLVITHANAEWSDPSADGERDANVMISFERQDGVAVIKAGGFVTPFHCKVLAGDDSVDAIARL
jgi:hypothetical protein